MVWQRHSNYPLWSVASPAGWRYPVARSALFRDPMLLSSALRTSVAIAVAIPVATGKVGR